MKQARQTAISKAEEEEEGVIISVELKLKRLSTPSREHTFTS
jgi:hypothetical protein